MRTYVLIHDSKRYNMTKLQMNNLFDSGQIYRCTENHETESKAVVFHILHNNQIKTVLREVGEDFG